MRLKLVPSETAAFFVLQDTFRLAARKRVNDNFLAGVVKLHGIFWTVPSEGGEKALCAKWTRLSVWRAIKRVPKARAPTQ
jgi:hypothetical protein